MGTISLAGLNKADVLAVLYNRSKPQGMGFLQYDPKPMTREEAQGYLEKTTYFDYLKGRVMKIDLSSDVLDQRLYDRDNGNGAAASAIDELRITNEGNSAKIQEAHRSAIIDSAQDARGRLAEKTTSETRDGMAIVTLGLADVADKLEPAIDKACKENLK